MTTTVMKNGMPNLGHPITKTPYTNGYTQESTNGTPIWQRREESPIRKKDINLEWTSSLEPEEVARVRKQKVAALVAKECIDDYEPPHQNGPDYIIPCNNFTTSLPHNPVRIRIRPSGPASAAPISIVSYLRREVDADPTKLHLTVKRNGEWVNWTLMKYWNDSRTAAKAFIKLGLQRFHGVGILGFNAPEWFITNMAAIFAGGLSVGIYTTNSPEACHHCLEDSKANIVVVENDLQVKKILEVRSRLPYLKAIVQYIGTPSHPDVLSWNELLEIGSSVPDLVLERRIKSIAINQCCTLIYTSGTTGKAKGVMLNHDNLTFSAMFIIRMWVSGKNHYNHSFVTYLPLSHIAAQIADIYVGLGKRIVMAFAQPDALKGSLGESLKEVKPTIFLGVPRVYEKIHEKFKEALGGMSYVKQVLIKWATGVAYQHTLGELAGRNQIPYGFALADKLLKKIRRMMGFQKGELYFSGAAPVSHETVKFFLGLGIVILECYGMSELSGPHIMNTIFDYKLNTVGKLHDSYEIRIDNADPEGNGEVCLRGRNVFMGYLNLEEKTVEVMDDDGWLHSGDIGKIDNDGFLSITGRLKELLITAGGENVAPEPIEKMLKGILPVIAEAVLIGDRRKFLSMLITLKTEIDMNTLQPLDTLAPLTQQWCRLLGSDAVTLEEILRGPDTKIMAAIQEAIDEVNKHAISNAQKIQKWTILPRGFSIAGGELGPTMKLKRNVVVKKYSHVIETFYAN